jgi:hypothetical protein
MRLLPPEVVTLDAQPGEECVPLEGQVLHRATPSIEFDVPTPELGVLEDSVVFVGPGTPSEPYEVSSSDLLEVMDHDPPTSPQAVRHPLWSITAPSAEDEELSVSRPILLIPEGEIQARSSRATRISGAMLAVAMFFGLVALQLETSDGAGARAGKQLQRALRTEAPRPARILTSAEPQPDPVFAVAHWITPPRGAPGAELARAKPTVAVAVAVAPHRASALSPPVARKIPTK